LKYIALPKYTLNINKTSYDVEVAAGTSLLWVLREDLGLTGAKYGYGIGQCGACTVHVDKQPIKACLLPIEQFTAGQEITTIEGLSEQRLGLRPRPHNVVIVIQVKSCKQSPYSSKKNTLHATKLRRT